ncbi:MAG: type I-E CRISPR-associated protein Cas6/Cse3/CasE [Anaeromyxobacter sp.]
MPSQWESGRRFGFEVRACPIVRMSSEGPKWRKGAEVDAFLARCWKAEGQPVEREAVYREWLARELDRRTGARLVSVEVEAFKRERVVRRDHAPERRASTSERPDVLFRGVLEVADGINFSALLARGVGRHRGFGFGMVLLRPE